MSLAERDGTRPRFSPRVRKRVHPLRWTLGLIAAAWLIGLVVFVMTLPEPEDDAGAQAADAIVVLTGGHGRLDAGFALLEAGAAPQLFISGVHRSVDVAALLDIAQRDPDRIDCCITLGYDAVDTAGNAAETAEWTALRSIDRVLLVTAHYHMPRALLEFRNAMPDSDIQPTPILPPQFRREAWALDTRNALLLISEYNKFLITAAAYFLGGSEARLS